MNYKRLTMLFAVSIVSAAMLVGCGKKNTSVNQDYSSAKADDYYDWDNNDYSEDYGYMEEMDEDVEESNGLYTASDEILNADLSSGSFQFMDSVFTIGKSTGDDILAFNEKQDMFIIDGGDITPNMMISDRDDVSFYTHSPYQELTFYVEADNYPAKISNTIITNGSYNGIEYGSPAGTAFLPSGIEVGVSTYDDVLAAYGEPISAPEKSSGWGYHFIDYEFDNFDVQIQFDFNKGVVCGFRIR